MSEDVIPGLKLIYQTSGPNLPDDPTFPYKMEASFRPPEFMSFTFVALYGGSEEIIVRAMTREALDKFIEMNDLKTHPRLQRITITGPEGVETIPNRN